MPASSPAASRVPRVLQSFRGQIALGFGALAATVAVALSIVLGSMFSGRIKEDELVVLRTIARNAARTLADGLSSRTREVETLAASPTLWTQGLASDRVAQAISRSQALTPYSAWIGVVSPDGVVQASTGRLLVGVDVSERPWFQTGRSGTHVGDVHSAKLLSSLLPRDSDGEPQRFVDFSAPIVDHGRLVGVLGMHGSWAWTRSVVESLFPDDAAARRLQVFVLDRQGEVIYSSAAPADDAALAAASAAAARPPRRSDDGAAGDFLSAVVKVQPADRAHDLGWTVIAREPASIGYAAARDSVVTALMLGVVAAAAACLLGWLLAERLTRPLRRIALAARRIESGELDVDLPLPSGQSEAAQLSAALGGMMSRLVRANLELESRVAERTAALQSANDELDRQARTDPLTGLLNRRGLDERFHQALLSARRRKAALSVLLVDIDHFKRVNDTHGHDAGDEALRTIAAAMSKRLRETDVVARHGGEEFVAVLPDTDARQARLVADHLVAAISQQLIATVGRVTISCGVTQMRDPNDSTEGMLRRADEALYRAKGEGRNRASFVDTGLELPADLLAG